jgi:succinylglutamic semialdehyde dehydrogenase
MSSKEKFKSANQKDVNHAVEVGRKSFCVWSQLKIDVRKDYLLKFAEKLEEEENEFALIISQETGKPLWESKQEVAAMVNKIAISFDAYQERCSPLRKDMDVFVRSTQFRPHGVVAVLGPFNLPGHLPHGHIVPALLAGNTILFKPSEYTPLTAEFYVALWKKIGLPSGVLQCIQGDGSTGKLLCEHPDLNGIFFTGSFQTGQAIHRLLRGHPEKIVALEMGGNNPLIVRSVKDLKAASYMTVQSAFITSGQRCTCARRLIVEEGGQTDEFIKCLIQMTSALQVGLYSDTPEPFMGPVISKESAQNILRGREKLKAQGGKVLLEMKCLDNNALLSPGIIDVTDIKKKEDVEIFGPLLQIIRVNNFDEAIKVANDTKYGLAAGLLSDQHEDWEKFYSQIQAGIVNWNRPTTGASSQAPFGGMGQSGNHRPGAYFAADYCAYPVASMENSELKMPEKILPGIDLKKEGLA